MSAALRFVTQKLAQMLDGLAFISGNDDIFRKWSSTGDICCAVAVKEFSSGDFVTVETGFVSPQILEWSGMERSSNPVPYEANGFGIFYRLEDLGIKEGFIYPAGGWRVASFQERAFFQTVLSETFIPTIDRLLGDLLTWNGWIEFFRNEVQKSPRGRGRAWALLGYSLLASPDRSISEIEAVIEEHSRQDASNKMGNRVDSDIQCQRELLRKRIGSKGN